MKKLTPEEKRELMAKLEQQMGYQDQQERKLARLRTRRRGLKLKNWMPGVRTNRSYTQQLREGMKERAAQHVVHRARQLRTIELSAEEKKRLSEYLG